MSFPQQAELEALAKKVPEGLTQEELDKLGKLTAEKSKWIADKAAIVTNIAKLIKKDNVSLIDLVKAEGYSKKDLEQAAIHFKVITNGGKENIEQTDQSNSEGKRVQKSGPVVFTFEKTGGFRSSLIRRDSTLPPTPNDSHIAFFLKPGKTKEKLLKLKETGSDNESFIKSPEGAQLIDLWVNWFDTKVKNFIEKHPEKVPAKA
jgi:hypothetical protein